MPISKTEEHLGQLVIKANDMIREFRYDLSVQEQRFLCYVVSLIKPTDDELKRYRISVNEYCDITDTGKDRMYAEFKKLATDFDDNRKWIEAEEFAGYVRWFSEIYYCPKQGQIEVLINSKLKPYLIGLKRDFTQYELWNLLSLKGKHSIRLYEIFKSYAFQREVELRIDKLKQLMCINDSYKEFKQFRRYVIDKSVKEINESTDINVTYQIEKYGNKALNIKFTITQKESWEGYQTYMRYLERRNQRDGQIKGQMSFLDKTEDDF